MPIFGWEYLFLCSSEIMNLSPDFGAIQNIAKLPTYTWKICRNCKGRVLQMSGTQNGTQEWTWFCPKWDLFCFDIFSNLNNIFHSKMDLF